MISFTKLKIDKKKLWRKSQGSWSTTFAVSNHKSWGYMGNQTKASHSFGLSLKEPIYSMSTSVCWRMKKLSHSMAEKGFGFFSFNDHFYFQVQRELTGFTVYSETQFLEEKTMFGTISIYHLMLFQNHWNWKVNYWLVKIRGEYQGKWETELISSNDRFLALFFRRLWRVAQMVSTLKLDQFLRIMLPSSSPGPIASVQEICTHQASILL